MPTFKAGWYVVSTSKQTGNVICRYFSTSRLVTAECHLTSNGLQILHWTTKSVGHEAGLPAVWSASFKYLENETQGDGWDNANKPATVKPAGRPAASPCDDLNNTCELCDRRGLLILPALYAVARADVAAESSPPTLQAPFGADLASHGLPASLAKYTLRTVRPGYLYVHNAKLGAAGWKAYQVSENGYLFEFDLHAKAPPPSAPPGNPCGRRVNSQVARCISIPDAKHVGKVYLTFSDTAWTADTLKAYQQNTDGRRDTMRCFDAAGWVASKGDTTQPHVAAAVSRLRDVSEFALSWSLGQGAHLQPAAADATATASHVPVGILAGPASVPTTFWPLLQLALADSLTTFRPIGHEAAATAAALARAGGGVAPALVALDDPTGIASDLNRQIYNRMSAWYEQPDRKWKRESASTVESLREAVKHGAVEGQRDTNQAVGGVLLTIMPAHAGPFMRGQGLADKYGNLRYMSEEQQDEVGTRAWQSDHVHLYRKPALENYLDHTFPSELKSFESSVVVPLDQAFCKWLKSRELADYFAHNFDHNDLDSGEAYAVKMSILLNDATVRRGVWDVVFAQLADDPANRKNVILRSLFLNQDALIADLANAVVDDGQGAAMHQDPFKWDKIAEKTWSAFKKIAKTDHYVKAPVLSGKAMDSAMNAVARVTHQLCGPITHKLGLLFDKSAAWTAAKLPEKRLMGLLGAIAKAGNPDMRLISMTAMSTRKAAARQIADAIGRLSQQQGQQYRSSVRTVLDRYEELNGQRYAFNAIAVVDGKEAERLKDYAASTLKGTRAEMVTSGVLRIERTEQVVAGSVNKIMTRDVKINLVSTFMLALTLRSAHNEMLHAGPTEKAQKTMAFAAGIAALAGVTIEVAGKVMEALPWGAYKYAQPLKFMQTTLKTRGSLLGFGGKFLGVIGSFVSGVLAIVDGWQSRGVSPVYAGVMIVLGVASIVGAILTLAGFTGPWGVAIGLLVAVIYMVIGFFKPTKIEKWLNASLWGNHAGGKRYETHQQELEALEALAEA